MYAARGLLAADLGGKSDPYVVLELDNARLQTHTEYKTVNPVWNRHFVFPVKDFHSTLYLTVYDDDSKHTFEFLGKLAVSLLRMESGKKRWYALKDKKLRCRAKGANPQILLEFYFACNSVRGAVRTINPKEERHMQSAEKFKRQVRAHLDYVTQTWFSHAVLTNPKESFAVAPYNLYLLVTMIIIIFLGLSSKRDANQGDRDGVRGPGQVHGELP